MPHPLSSPRRNPFSGGPDRAAERRRDRAWVQARLADPATRFLPVWELRSAVLPGDPPRALRLAPGEVELEIRDGATPILLGEQAGVALFALELTAEAASGVQADWVDLRGVGATLDAEEAALLAHARALVHWHRGHRFCGVCGHPTAPAEAGHVRLCTSPACGTQHFPRTDPAVIVLVTAGERCLLGRQAAWDAGRYATLAGFVEPGESLEEAVAREVYEEVGIRVAEVRYHSSQPWPFPASLMLGFTATALTHDVRVDPSELEDARWFTREQLRRGIARGRLSLPSPVSIAHALIRDWLDAPGA